MAASANPCQKKPLIPYTPTVDATYGSFFATCPARTLATMFPNCTTKTSPTNLLTDDTPPHVWEQLRKSGHVTWLPEGALHSGDAAVVVSGQTMLCKIGNGAFNELEATLEPTVIPTMEILIHASIVPTLRETDGTMYNVILVDRVLATSEGPFIGVAEGNRAILHSVRFAPGGGSGHPEIAVAWRERATAEITKSLLEFALPSEGKGKVPHDVAGLRFDLPHALGGGVGGDWVWLDKGRGGCVTRHVLLSRLAHPDPSPSLAQPSAAHSTSSKA